MTTLRVLNSGTVSDVTPSGWSPNGGGYPPITLVLSGGNPDLITGVTWAGVTGLVLGMSGATSARPVPNNQKNLQFAGVRYLDTTLGKLLIHDGYFWRDPVTGSQA